jgi:hypothetical protein
MHPAIFQSCVARSNDSNPLLSARTLLDFVLSIIPGSSFEEFLWAHQGHHNWVTTATLAPMIGQGVATVALLVAVSLYSVVFLESGTQQVSHSPDPPSFCTPPSRHNILSARIIREYSHSHTSSCSVVVCVGDCPSMQDGFSTHLVCMRVRASKCAPVFNPLLAGVNVGSVCVCVCVCIRLCQYPSPKLTQTSTMSRLYCLR